MPARAVIINADDLGLAPTVSDGIFAAHAQGAVSDSSVFANAPALAELLARAAACGLPVGLHLNLTYGRPLVDPARIPALVTPDGAFMKRRRWTLPLPAAQVRLELAAQLQRLRDLGWQPSHLDSHHHIHVYPEILPVVIKLARSFSPSLPVRAVDAAMRGQLTAAGIPSPDCFSTAFYGEHATVETLIRLVEACPGGVLELMTHPGYSAPDLPSSYREEREQELRVLTTPAWREYLAAREISLVGFGDYRIFTMEAQRKRDA